MHLAPFDNKNQPIVNVDNERVPLNYFNILKLSLGEEYSYQLVDFESCVVPATGRVSVAVDGTQIAQKLDYVQKMFGMVSQRVSMSRQA